MLPKYGHIGILCITDKQFGNMEIYFGKQAQDNPNVCQQLEMF